MPNAFEEEYLSIMAELDGDEAGRRAAWERMVEGNAYRHGVPAGINFLPRLYSQEMRAFFKTTSETMYGILAKVLRRYRDDKDYRREFRFDPRVEELVAIPNPYEEPLPFGRVDLLLDEETLDFRFCEFNSDSSSGMNENAEALAAIRLSETYRRFAAHHTLADDVERDFTGLVDDFTRIYRSTGAPAATRLDEAGAQKPRLALVVLLDLPKPALGEMERYREYFMVRGYECSVFDARELEFDGERLIGRNALVGESDMEIDVIWRFCIVVDLLAHWDEVQGYVEAVRQGKVVMIGGFSTQVIHDKQVLAVLRRPATLAMLDERERAFVEAHVPATYFLDDPALEDKDLAHNKDQWVLKPADWYESNFVVAGRGVSDEEWAAALDEARSHASGSRFLVQEYFAPGNVTAIPLDGNEADFTAPPRRFGNLPGLLLFDGEFSGIYARQSDNAVISGSRGAVVCPILWVD